MYCRKCGKFIEYEGEICKECLGNDTQPKVQGQLAMQVEQPITAQAEENIQVIAKQESVSVQPQLQSSNSGFGMALASIIVGAVARSMSSIAEAVLLAGAEYIADINAITPSAEETFYSMAVVGGIILVLALGGAIPAIVMGIKSIIAFARGKKSGSSNVAVLVLGIVGIALALNAVSSILTYCVSVVDFVTPLYEIRI
ncbi:MAG: hypothetical protein J6C23_08930 [Clostridia bacterium]|nr:hypothetical protein [Clostridia bacterium]